jgi:preprotein translocase subunit SecF
MFVVTYRKLFYVLSVVLLLISFGAMYKFGFNFGIDFKGGAITEVSYPNGRPEQEVLRTEVDKLALGNYILQPVGENLYSIRTRELTQAEQATLQQALSLNGQTEMKVEQFNSIGPSVGNELRRKAYIAIGIVMLCIVLFITFAFRKVSEPVASWKYGLATIVALLHDIVIPTGLFIIFIHYNGGEIDTLFVSALLAILGFSVHDTIVVFDRVRENLRINREERNRESFDITVGKSLNQTFGRSINTSVTIFLVLLALYVIGGETTRDFALVLIIGIIAGTYSSIFVASPLLVTLFGFQDSKTGKKKA